MIRRVMSHAALAGVVMSPFGAAHAGPTAGASDTATPVYISSSTPSTYNKFDCTRGDGTCELLVTTKMAAYPCTTEVVTLPSTAVPALLYNTFCAVTLHGVLTIDPLEQSSPFCVLDGTQKVYVTFTSGANSAFNGTFPATATFKPTGVSGSNVTRARITVKGGGALQSVPTANGWVVAQFDVSFGGVGLNNYCAAPNATGLTTVVSGSVTTRF